MRDSAVRRWSKFHKTLFRLSGGRLGARLVDNDILLLTSTGHRTGKPHTVPLLFLRDGENLAVIASYGGRPTHPAWYLNLRQDPEVTVHTREGRSHMTARTATTTERAEWWPRIVDSYDGYAVYQSRTEREIPVVILEPIEESEN